MKQEILLTNGALTVPCQVTEPEDGHIRRVVLGVHGLGGSAMDAIQTALAEEMGLFRAATVRFDFPAHGKSPLAGEAFHLSACMDSLMAAARFAKARYPQVQDLCIFATGFGAYITFLCMDDLLALPGSIRLVVHTPSVLMHETLLAMGRINEPTLRAMDHITFQTERPLQVSYRFYLEMKQHIILNSYPLPFLMLHGEEDSYIPMENIQHLRRINEGAKLVIIPGTSHRFQEDGAWDMVLDLTRDWFEFQQVLVTDWE